MLKYKLSVILGLPILNSTISDYCYLTVRVISAKDCKDNSDTECFPVMEHMDKFNSYFTAPYNLRDKCAAKQDAIV